ncbi:MAG: GAK system ATP-grasp enzyme [Thermodesulfobacteriota bacterium]|nr:GAK system ATP-grasp enzyme [Thermodesulfobacteriota bacterium]
MKIGVVGVPGGWSSEKLVDAVYQKTGYRLLIDMCRVRFDLAAASCRFEDIDLLTLDALMVKKIGARYSPDLLDRLEMLRFMSGRGLPVFSPPEKMLRVIDRLSCTVTLRLAGIPMPATTITESVDAAIEAVCDYGQAVLKPLFSSKARGMVLVNARPDVRETIERFRVNNPIMYIQKQIDHKGRDLGVVFLGGNYLTTYARCANGETWNTTIRSGGGYAACTPSEDIIRLAHSAQRLFGLDFTCVDVAETDDGPVVFEVSAFGGFKGIQNASGLDAAGLYVEYVLNRLKEAGT